MLSRLICKLDDFKIIKTLGNGAFGQVFLVKNIKTNIQYAAKVSLHPSFTDEDQIIFFSEIEALSFVKNPAVLGLVGFNLQNFSKEGYPTIITEYMPNDSLKKILELEHRSIAPHEWTETKKYINLLGISLGMQYLHSNNIVHRDLKPENVLLDENYYPHICDFGFSKFLNGKLSQNFMKSGVGTPLYMAPEILLEKEYNFKVDVYSFSLIAYEIITNQEITIEGNFFSFMNNVIKGKRPDVSVISNKTIKFFLQKCWSNDPDERPSFDHIIEILCSHDFYSSFEFDIDEVIDYVDKFPSDNPILKNFVDHLENKSDDNNNNIQQCDKIRVKLKHDSLPANFRINIGVTGENSKGNTSLIQKFKNPNFDIYTVESTIGSSMYYKMVNTKHGKVPITIFDAKIFPGRETDPNPFSNSSYLHKDCHAMLLAVPAYEVLEMDSFQNFINLVERSRNGKPVFLVALRCDLEWKLDNKVIEEIVTKYNYKFFKTSALNGENVDLVFNEIIEVVIQKCLEGFYDDDEFLSPFKVSDQQTQRDSNEIRKSCLIY